MRFKTVLAVIAGVLPASLVLVLGFIGIYAWPAIRFNGVSFVLGNYWNLGSLYGNPVTINGMSIEPGAQYGTCSSLSGPFYPTGSPC